MQGKLEQVRRLLADGYELDDVVDDGLVMEAIFRRGPRTMTVRFLPNEAEALLLARGPLRLERRR